MFSKNKRQAVIMWTALTLILDLATKAMARHYFNFSSCEQMVEVFPVEVIPGLMDFIFTCNTGAAFSLFSSDAGDSQGLKMAALSIVSLLPFIYFYVKAKPGDRLILCSLGLIWGGALGNIHDRLRWNAVVDFIDFYWRGSHWPAFNVADIGICVGAGLLVLSILREKPE